MNKVIDNYMNRIELAWATLKFRMRPFTCVDCGRVINFRFPEYHHRLVVGKPVMVHLFGHKVCGERQGICKICATARIHTLFAEIKPNTPNQTNTTTHTGTTQKQCDGCGHVRPTINISFDPHCDIRFGGRWWNGHVMCERCLTEATSFGRQTCGRTVWLDGIGYEVNQDGAAVNVEHWWDILFP